MHPPPTGQHLADLSAARPTDPATDKKGYKCGVSRALIHRLRGSKDDRYQAEMLDLGGGHFLITDEGPSEEALEVVSEGSGEEETNLHSFDQS